MYLRKKRPRARARPNASKSGKTKGAAELVVVGTGIQLGRDLTDAARWHIKAADKVYFVVSDPIAAGILQELNPNAESLHTLYHAAKPRIQTYQEMTERIMASLRAGLKVCVAVYGHPGVFAFPTHRAIELARQEGYIATMLPAVSSIDCLFADLGWDPAERGLQIYDATDFLQKRRTIDTATAIVLLQIASVGESAYTPKRAEEGLQLLVERLTAMYGADHEATVYSASEYVWGNPSIQNVTVGTLADAHLDHGSTLFIRPSRRAALDGDMTRRLERRPVARKN